MNNVSITPNSTDIPMQISRDFTALWLRCFFCLPEWQMTAITYLRWYYNSHENWKRSECFNWQNRITVKGRSFTTRELFALAGFIIHEMDRGDYNN